MWTGEVEAATSDCALQLLQKGLKCAQTDQHALVPVACSPLVPAPPVLHPGPHRKKQAGLQPGLSSC